MDQVISRQQAIFEKLPRYYTGRPCKRGHDSYRYTSNGVCVACNDLQAAQRKASMTADEWDQYTVQTATLARGGADSAGQARSLGLKWFKRRTDCGHDVVQLDGERCWLCEEGMSLDAKLALDLLS